MTEMKSAAEILKSKKSVTGWLKMMPSDYQKEEIISAMHSFAENAVKEFADRVKTEPGMAYTYDSVLNSLRDQLISEIKEK